AVGRNDDDGHVGGHVVLAEPVDHLLAGHHRHVQIDQGEVDPVSIHLLEPLLAVARLVHLADRQAAHLERADDHLAHHRAVVDDENVQRHHASSYVVPLDFTITFPVPTQSVIVREIAPPTSCAFSNTPFFQSSFRRTTILREPIWNRSSSPRLAGDAPPATFTTIRSFRAPAS